MKHWIPIYLSMLFAISVHAQVEGRLTVVAEDAELELVRHTDGAMLHTSSNLNAEGTKTLHLMEVTMPVVPDEWQQLSLTFKTKADANVILQLGGGRGDAPAAEILFDKVEPTGTTVLNGDFEAKGPRAPKDWRVTAWAEDQDSTVPTNTEPASGSYFAKVNTKTFISQNLTVPKDTEITISVMIRSPEN